MADIYQKKGPIWKISTEKAAADKNTDIDSNISEKQTENFKTIPKIKDIIGEALNKIGPFHNLSTEEQVVALINDVIPIRKFIENLK